LTSYFTDLTEVASITAVVDWILIYLFISALNMPPGVASQPVLVFSGFLLIVAGFAGMGSGRWSAADASISSGWAKGNPAMLREDSKNIGSRKAKRSMHYPAMLTVGVALLILYYFTR
jgi:hypothetical protein